MFHHNRALTSYRAIQIPAGYETVFAALPFNPDEKNSAIHVSYQIGWDNSRDNALVQLLSQVLSTPTYDSLRTKQQLGYIVWSDVELELGVLYYYVLIQSAVKTPDALEAAIEENLSSCATLLNELSEEQFLQHRSSLQAVCSQPYSQLSDLFQSTWYHIAVRKFQRFGYRFHLAQVLNSLTKADLIQFYQQHVLDKATRRKLVIQSWPFGSQINEESASTHRSFIQSSLDTWKSSQPLFPVPSPASMKL